MNNKITALLLVPAALLSVAGSVSAAEVINRGRTEWGSVNRVTKGSTKLNVKSFVNGKTQESNFTIKKEWFNTPNSAGTSAKGDITAISQDKTYSTFGENVHLQDRSTYRQVENSTYDVNEFGAIAQ